MEHFFHCWDKVNIDPCGNCNGVEVALSRKLTNSGGEPILPSGLFSTKLAGGGVTCDKGSIYDRLYLKVCCVLDMIPYTRVCRITAITRASQARDEGSTPFRRFLFKLYRGRNC